MTLTLKAKSELTVPASIRRLAGLKAGDQVEFKVSRRRITIVPKLKTVNGDYTQSERRAIDRGIAASEKDYRQGRSHGPFKDHGQFIASLHAEAAKVRGKKK
jgi:AbrB family looped-hinge helix DNA binding protein